jgi:hypothetical protein
MPNLPSTPRPRGDLTLLTALYIAEFALVLIGLSLNRKGDRALGVWILTTPGMTFVAATLAALVGIALIGRQYFRQRESASRTFEFVVAMNLITLAFILVPTELALRAFAQDTPDSRSIGGRTLFPRSWEQAAEHNLRISEKASKDLSYLVYDDTLGWTVGRSRRSANGMYLSSADGLRAPRQGVVLARPKDRPRVALVGDSFVFAEQVPFEHSWGHLLESNSAGRHQVLNFGVGGYGLDQAYLRFKKDALAWKPDVVVFAFPLTDLVRSMTVYPFIEWSGWDIPFSKPRLIRDAAGLRVLNVPTLTPSAIFRKPAITDLPFLEFDVGYRRHEWHWSISDIALLKRWLFAFFPPWVEKNQHVSDDELVLLNAEILRDFIRVAMEHGVVPIIVYLPGKPEILRVTRRETTDGQRIMKRIGLPFVDTTPCVMELNPEDAYIVGDPHYSPKGNAAVAKCIAGAVDRSLTERARRGAPRPASTGGSS